MKKNKSIFKFIYLSIASLVFFLTASVSINAQPTFTTTPVTTATVGSVYTYSAAATDQLNNTLTFTAPVLPSFLTFSPNGSNSATAFGSAITIPIAVAGDANGNAYVSGGNNYGTIYKIAADGTTTVFSTGANTNIYGMVVIGNYLYGSSYLAGTIFRIDLNNPGAGQQVVYSSGGNFSYIGIIDHNGYLYISDYGNMAIRKLDLSSFALTTVCATPTNCWGVGFDQSNNLFITGYTNQALYKWDGSTLTTAVANLGAYAADIKFDNSGNAYLSFRSGSSGIRKYKSDFSSYVSVTASVTSYGMGFSATGALLFGDYSNSQVYKLQTGAVLTGTPAIADIGVHNVSLHVTNGTTSADQNFTVTVYGPATLSAFPDINKTTSDVPFTLTDPTSNSAGAFTYTSSNTAVATISGNTVTIVGAGTSTITATQAANGLYTATTITATLTVAAISNNANLSNLIISSGTLSPSFASSTTSYTDNVSYPVSTVTVTPTVAQANATVQVQVNGGAYSTVSSGSASAALALNVGANTINVLVTAQDGSTTKNYTITVNRAAQPVITTTGTLNAFAICAGTASAEQSFTVSGINLTAALIVTAPTGFEVSTTSGTGYAASVSLTPGSGTVANTTIYIRLAASATGTPSGNITVASTGATTQNVAASGTVNTLPTATIGGTTAVCQNTSSPNVTFTGAAGTAPYTFSYTLNGGATQTVATTSGNSVTVSVPTSSAGPFVFSLVGVQDASSTACSNTASGTAAITVNPLPNIGINVGAAAICNGNSTTLTGTGGGTYTWSPASSLSASTGTTVTATPVNTTTYTVTGTALTTSSIVYNQAFTQGVVPTTQATAWQAFRTSLVNTNTYTGFTIKGSNNTTGISCTDPAVATAIANALRTGTNYTGTSDGQTWYVGVGCSDISNMAVELSANQGLCACGNYYSVRPEIGNTNWGGIAGITCGASSQTMEVDFFISTPGAGCSNTATQTITVNPLPTATISGTTAVCQNTSSPNVTFTGATGTAPYTFSYTINGGTTQTVTTTSGNSVTVAAPTTGSGTFVYSLVSVQDASSTSCSNTVSGTATVTVNPTPAVTNSVTASSICSATATNIGLTSSVASTFAWTLGTNTGGITGASASNGATISQTLTNPLNTTAGSIVYSVIPTSTVGNCVGSATNFTVTVNPTPAVTNAVKASSICSATASNIGLTSSAASTFAWTLGTNTGGITGASAGNGATISQILTNPVNTTAGSIIYSVIPTSTVGNCIGSATNFTVTVNPTPVVTNTITTETICNTNSTAFALTASTPSSFSWTLGPVGGGITGEAAGSGSSIIQTLINPSNNAAGSVVYSVTPTSTTGSCKGSAVNFTVTVNPTPASPVITVAPATTLCQFTNNQNFAATQTGYGNDIKWGWQVFTGASVRGANIYDSIHSSTGRSIISFPDAGQVRVRVIDTINATKCYSFTDMVFTITQTPSSASLNDPVYYYGENLSIGLNTASQYQWGYDSVLNLNTVVLNGQTQQNYFVNPLDTAHVSYWVIATGSNGCYSKNYYNTPTPFGIHAVSIATNTLLEDRVIVDLKAYPNPVSNLLNVGWNITDPAFKQQTMRFMVMGINGNVLEIKEVTDAQAKGSVQLNLGRYTAGTYLIKVYRENELITTEKIIKN